MRGVANRDLAVREARGELIFYNDDDDLLLPHHVSVLSRALRDADIADTPAASVTPSGRVDLGLHDSAHGLQRRLLESGDLKVVFDTHLGHRKDAYLALGGPWLKATDWNSTLFMFGAFAADARIRWRSLQRITALSFHGRRRITMSGQDRKRELANWSGKSRRLLFEHRLRRSGSYSFYTFMLARAFAKAQASREETRAYLASLLHKASAPFGPTSRQRRALDTVLALVFGGHMADDGARDVFTDLLDARLGPDIGSIRRVIELFRRCQVPDQTLLEYLSGRANVDSTFARLYLDAADGVGDSMLLGEADDAFAVAPSETKFFFAEAVAGLLVERRNPRAAWDWSERALPLAPQSFLSGSFWSQRVQLAKELGYVKAEEEASRHLGTLGALMD